MTFISIINISKMRENVNNILTYGRSGGTQNIRADLVQTLVGAVTLKSKLHSAHILLYISLFILSLVAASRSSIRSNKQGSKMLPLYFFIKNGGGLCLWQNDFGLGLQASLTRSSRNQRTRFCFAELVESMTPRT